MKGRIFEFIVDAVKENAIELKQDSILADLIDSVTFVKMVVGLESEFDFEFEDEMLAVSKFPTANDLVDYVEKQASLQ
jgi:acyl carrier protein